jgi:hypothetical protein
MRVLLTFVIAAIAAMLATPTGALDLSSGSKLTPFLCDKECGALESCVLGENPTEKCTSVLEGLKGEQGAQGPQDPGTPRYGRTRQARNQEICNN